MKLFKDSRSGYYKVRFRTDFGVRTISTKTKSLQRQGSSSQSLRSWNWSGQHRLRV